MKLKPLPIRCSDVVELEPIHARVALPLGDTPPEWFMWMPAGTHQLNALKGTKPIKLGVKVDASSALAVQAAFAEFETQGLKPYFDFDHAESEASAWPREFAWRDTPAPGIYCRVEWSTPGAEAVTGKSFRSFSPTFFESKDQPAKVIGAPLCMGGLVNDPAFKKIVPLWAKEAAPADAVKPTGGIPAATTGAPMKLKFITAHGTYAKDATIELPDAEAAGYLESGVAIHASTAKTFAALEESAKTLRETNQKQAEAIKARAKIDAAAKVEAAVTRGAIAPKDEAIKAKWVAMIEADPAHAELLEALPGKEPVMARITKPAGSGVTIPHGGQVGAVDAVKAFRDQRDGCDLSNPVRAKESAAAAGAIYARDLRPVIEGDGLLPIMAADTLVTDIVSQRVFDFLRYEFPLLSRISTRFSDQQLVIGQNVIVHTVTPPDLVAYNTSTGWPDSTTVTADINVPMSAQKGVQIAFQSDQLSGTNRRLFDEQAAPAAYTIKKDLMDTILALVTTAFTNTAVTVALADWKRLGVIAIKNAMKKAQIPMFNPFLLLSIDYYDKLAEDESIVSVAIQGSGDAIRTGQLPVIHGLLPIEAQNEAFAGTIEGLGAIPDALCVATGLPTDYTTVFPGVNAGGQVRLVTDAEIGLSMMEVKFIDHKLAAARMRLAYMRGAARGPVTHGLLLKSA